MVVGSTNEARETRRVTTPTMGPINSAPVPNDPEHQGKQSRFERADVSGKSHITTLPNNSTMNRARAFSTGSKEKKLIMEKYGYIRTKLSDAQLKYIIELEKREPGRGVKIMVTLLEQEQLAFDRIIVLLHGIEGEEYENMRRYYEQFYKDFYFTPTKPGLDLPIPLHMYKTTKLKNGEYKVTPFKNSAQPRSNSLNKDNDYNINRIGLRPPGFQIPKTKYKIMPNTLLIVLVDSPSKDSPFESSCFDGRWKVGRKGIVLNIRDKEDMSKFKDYVYEAASPRRRIMDVTGVIK